MVNGEWTDPAQSAALAEKLELQGKDLTITDLEGLSQSSSYRPKSYRYKDPPQILQMIRQRRQLVGKEARELGKDILRMRQASKAAWLTELLDRGSQGDYRAIAYFKRRQNILTMHSNYVVRAGGTTKAAQDLKNYFRITYTPPDPLPNEVSAVDLYTSRVHSFEKPSYITPSELTSTLALCKAGKSCGEDGISYELLSLISQTDLGPHLCDLFNSILFQTTAIPQQWLVSRLTFIPKIPTPSLPKHLRPIVLSSTPGKLFAKILMSRIRSSLPPPSANQIACIPGFHS